VADDPSCQAEGSIGISTPRAPDGLAGSPWIIFYSKNKSARFLELSFIDLDLSEPILQNFHVA
jgi:hypothetical protein